MTQIIATNRLLYFAAEYNAEIVISGQVEPTGAIATLLTLYADVDENTFLGKLIGLGGTYNPLPPIGEQVEGGKIYSYGTDLVICRQTHFYLGEASLTNITLWLVYRPGQDDIVLDWVYGERVEIGTHRIYQDVEYVCIQAHVTEFTPDLVLALWNVVPSSAEWQAGVAYKIGDEVTYQNALYRCRQSHTSQIGWEPPNVPALWLLV